jgi:hypothetical protein
VLRSSLERQVTTSRSVGSEIEDQKDLVESQTNTVYLATVTLLLLFVVVIQIHYHQQPFVSI